MGMFASFSFKAGAMTSFRLPGAVSVMLTQDGDNNFVGLPMAAAAAALTQQER
jgi:hypothetical protein